MSLSKRLIAGGAADEYLGGEFTYTAVAQADSDIDVTTGVKPDFLFIFPKPGINNNGLSVYNWLFDKDFLGTKQYTRAVSSWFSAQNTDVIDWNDDGFTIKYVETGSNRTDFYMNASLGASYSGLAFKTSDTAVTNTDGDITSTVYANSDSNISKISWISTGSNGVTVGHGLGVTPDVVMIVRLNNWSSNAQSGSSMTGSTIRYDSNIGTWRQELNDIFQGPDGAVFGFSANSSTINVGTSAGHVGSNGQRMLAYCFASKSGFSKHQSYLGNASATTRTVASTDFNPISVWAMGDRSWYMFLICAKTSGSLGSLPRWDNGDMSALNAEDSTATLETGGFVRVDQRTNKRVLFNTNSFTINGTGDYNGILTFGGDSWWHTLL